MSGDQTARPDLAKAAALGIKIEGKSTAQVVDEMFKILAGEKPSEGGAAAAAKVCAEAKEMVVDRPGSFCTCGQSKTYPKCDSTHIMYNEKVKANPRFQDVIIGTRDMTEPIKFMYCTCKKSKNMPYCDGTNAN